MSERDVVVRLREEARWLHAASGLRITAALLTEAADEIERLRGGDRV